MKKLLAFLMTALTLIVMVLPSAFAKTDSAVKKNADFSYTELEDGTLEIKHCYSPSKVKKLVIPEKIDGKTVSTIGSYAFTDGENYDAYVSGDYFTVEELVLPNSIKRIYYSAFAGCSTLKKVTFGKNIEFIDSTVLVDTAYAEDEKNWYNNMLYVGDYLIDARNYNPYAPDSPVGDFKLKPGTKLIAANAFSYVEMRSQNITIPNSVKYINREAFVFRTSLPESFHIIVPPSVVDIGYHALGENVKYIKGYNGTYAEKYANENNLKFVPLAVKKLDQVKNLKVTSKSYDRVKLSWQSVVGGKYYIVYKSLDGKKWSQVGTVSSTSATVKNLKDNTKYHFRVRALDNTKKIRGKASATTYGKTTVKYVRNLAVSKYAATALALTWEKLPGAKTYRVYQSVDGKKWTRLTVTSENKFTVKKLKAGTHYQFRVAAYDSKNKKIGKASAVLETATLTAAPKATLKSTKSKTATVSWKAVNGAKAYAVYMLAPDGKHWAPAGKTKGTSITLKNLVPGKKAYIKVYAANEYGKLSAASEVKGVTVKK